MKTRLIALLGGLALAACSEDAGPQLVVVVHSDYAVPAELSSIEVSVATTGGTPDTHTFDLSETPLPLSFGVLPPDGDLSTPVRIDVRGVGPAADRAPYIRRRLEKFPDTTSRLAVFLAKTCEAVSCPAEQTCTEMACVPELVEPAALTPIVVGEELDGLCTPKPDQCTEDRKGVVRCSRWGAPETTMPCPGAQTCDPDQPRCTGGDLVEFRFELSIGGDADGRVRSVPEGLDCGLGQTRCNAFFPKDSSIRLSVVDTTGTFAGWGGACIGPGECVVQMDGDKQVSASFVLQESFPLSVTPSGTGGGTITSEPVGIDCGSTCRADFLPATLVTLSALPDPSSTFAQWTGACSGTGDCVLTMSSELVVGAEFVRRSGPQTLTIVPAGDGNGTVVSNPAGIDCGTSCTAEFPFDSRVTLEAMAGAGSVFSGWLGNAACSGDQDCSLLMDQSYTITAEFVPDTGVSHRVTLNKQGTGDGEVQSDNGALVCPAGCVATNGDFLQGSTAQLRATPSAGATFVGWAGDCTFAGSDPLCPLPIDGPKNIIATFNATPLYPVQITVSGGGRVTGPGIDCPTDCTESFPAGASVPLTAQPGMGEMFASFTGGGCAQYAPCTVNVSAPGVNVTAAFQPIAASPYDFNNDGLVDLLFAAPDYDAGNGTLSDAGRVYVRFGGLAGPSLPPELASSADRMYTGVMSGAQFGASLAAVGDMVGDGASDFAVGSPGENGDSGIVRVIAGGSNLPPSGPTGSLMPPTATIVGTGGMRLGASLAVVPDMDGDGRTELLVGAPGAGPGAPGSAHLFLSSMLGTGGGVGLDAVTFGGNGGGFGAQVTSIGDHNGDGQPDLAVSAPTFGPMAEGRVSIYFGPFTPSGADRLPDRTITGATPALNAGSKLLGIGDFNNDTLSDLAIGATNVNSVFIFFGSDVSTGFSETTNDADVVLSGGGFFGISLAAGDVTADGIADVLVGAPFESGLGRGSISIYAGGPGPLGNPWGFITGNCALLGNCDAEGLGRSVTVWGDLNRDGQADVLVGSDYGGGAAGSEDRGRITAFYGGVGLAGSTSSGAPIQIVGEDQLRAHCSSLPASRAD